MSSEQFHSLLIAKLDDIVVEQRNIRSEMREEHKQVRSDIAGIREQISNITERLSTLEIKFKLQQWLLYTGSAAAGALMWKLPALFSWISEQF